MIRANNENRKELQGKVKFEIPVDPAGPPLGLSPEKTRIEKTQAATAALQPYSR